MFVIFPLFYLDDWENIVKESIVALTSTGSVKVGNKCQYLSLAGLSQQDLAI